jgi:nucleotide-binding universal stress UspA family protein
VIGRILVALDGSEHADVAAALALGWARRFGAGLVALGILDEPTIRGAEAVPVGGAAYKRQRDEARLVDAQRRIVEFLLGFRERCQLAGVPCAVIEDVGVPDQQIVLEAEMCDVVVLGRRTNFHFETQEVPDRTLSHVLRRSPRPIVIAPSSPAAGEGVLVAYGGGLEVARTLQVFALLGLAGDEPVDLLTIDADAGVVEQRLERAAVYLRAHDVEPRLHRVVTDAAPGPIILDEVRRRRPRLLVMGAHGHHPVRDLFFTSVLRTVLRDAPVPVFTGA